MKHSTLLIATALLLLLSLLINSNSIKNCQAYVLDSAIADMDYGAELKPVETFATETHITRLVKPSEIRLPTLEEITTFIHAADESKMNDDKENENEYDKKDATKLEALQAAEKQSEEQEDNRKAKSLTYGELAKLLAQWQMENDKNVYELKAPQQ